MRLLLENSLFCLQGLIDARQTYIHESLTEPEHDEYDNKREMVAESALAAKTQEVHSAEDEFELLAITIFSVAGMNASRKPQVEN